MYDRKTPITAADLLNDRVLPFFEEHDVKLLRVLTDRGSEYCGNPDQLEELNKQLTEERDQFLERYYRLVTQFELMGGSFDRARAGITDAIGYLRGRPEKQEQHEMPALPVSKSAGNGNGLENGIAKIAAALEDGRRREEHENS